MDLFQKYRILIIVSLAFAGGAWYELTFVDQSTAYVSAMAAPNPAANVLIELYPQRLGTKCLEADQALYLRYDLKAAKKNLEQALANNYKDDPSYYYNYASVVVMLDEPQDVVEEAVRKWRTNGIPVQEELDPRLIYKDVSFPLPPDEGLTQLLAKSLDGRRVVMAPEMAPSGDRFFAQVHHLFERNLAYRTSNISASSRFTALNLSPNGSHLITANEGGTIAILDLNQQQTLHRLSNPSGDVHAVAVLPTHNLAVTGDHGGVLRLWDLTSGEVLTTLQGSERPLSSIAISHDQSHIAAGNWNGDIKVWRLSSTENKPLLELVSLNPSAHQGVITKLVFNSDGTQLASASRDHKARMWNLDSTPQELFQVEHKAPVYGLDISPDGSHLVTSGEDRQIKIWATASGKEQKQIQVFGVFTDSEQIALPIYSVLFSMDSQEIIVVNNRQEIQKYDY